VYISVVDWDDDKDQDLLIGDASGYVHVYLNSGTREEPALQEGFRVMAGGKPVGVGSRAAPDLVDINGDGRRDLIVGSMDGFIMVYPNIGARGRPVFSGSYKLTFKDGSPINVGTRSAPRFFDWDGDGLRDMLVGELMGYVYFIRNTGTDNRPFYNKAVKLRLEDGRPLRYPLEGARSRLSVADWDGDGIFDILLGGMDGRVILFRGTGEPLRIKRWRWLRLRFSEEFRK